MRNLRITTSFTTKSDETNIIENYADLFAKVLADKLKDVILQNTSYISIRVFKGNQYNKVSLSINLAPSDIKKGTND